MRHERWNRQVAVGRGTRGAWAYAEMTERNREDCLDVIETMKHIDKESLPMVGRVVAALVALGIANFGMMQGALKGETLTEMAISMGTTKQAAHQRWARMTSVDTRLEAVVNKRRRLK